ncbi:MAG: hypothetical protein K5899_10575 [Bacteroidaceae bacterium]|nr:hypothetical protein [Bacteroidaceae bacterium]
MSNDKNNIEQVYAASDSGLDIIKRVCPQVADVVGTKKHFKLRPDERTASASLYPPKDGDDCWHVKDFGISEEGGYFSPIDLYMWSNGYSKSQFSLALHELMEQYGVAEKLTSTVNRPEISRRSATESEKGQPPRVVTRHDFTASELSTWGPCVKPEHLTELGWKAVESVTITKGSEVIVKKSTPTYPIFAEDCQYQDDHGNICSFQKLYEPKNPDKAYRFMIVGKKPSNYIFGLSSLRRKYQELHEEKLNEVVLVSGGSDAVNLLSMGYQPIWLGSETEELREDDLRLLLKYAKRIVNIPDIDATGRSVGQRLALRFPILYTAWFKKEDMCELHDNRGRKRKDLKDFIQLHHDRESLQKLIARAKRAQFWIEVKDPNNPDNIKYELSRASLDYFLELNGFFTIKDNDRKEPRYIKIEGNKVCRIPAKSIVNFVGNWADEQGLPEALHNKLKRCRDLPTNDKSTLNERDDLDFARATVTSQRFYFKNCVVDVTAEKITCTPYSLLSDGKYVWEDSIIQHTFKQLKPQFVVEKGKDGRYHYALTAAATSKFFRFIRNTSRLYWRKVDEDGQELTPEEQADEEQCTIAKLANIGYLLHGYKSESEPWATICQDAKLGETEKDCNGRSGKSFYRDGISTLLRTFPIEARTASITENRFLFDGVTADTDLITVDECSFNLNYDFFFGKITGPFRGEEKGNHPFLIPFSQSPKFWFGTNYVIRRHDPSTEGRLWPQVFGDYYHIKTKDNDYRETRTIFDDFGENLMGTEYAESDWQADIAFLLECLQFYLSLPKSDRKQMPPLKQIERREQKAAVGKVFRQWAEEFYDECNGNLDREIMAQTILNEYNRDTGNKWSMTMLTRNLKAYCEYATHLHCLNPASVTGRKNNGEPWVKRENGKQERFYYVQSLKAHLAECDAEAAEGQELPF